MIGRQPSLKQQEKSVFALAFPRTLPVLAGYIFLGIAYGITMKAGGLEAKWTALASVAVYGGSMQFALVGLLQEAFAPVTVLLMTLLIQARHIFYGLSMLAPYGRQKGALKQYLIFALTDETYSLVVQGAPEGVDEGRYFFAVSLLDQIYWVTGSVIGAIAGQIIPFDMTGIDFAMTALFTVIVTEQTMDAWKGWKEKRLSAFDAVFPTALGLVSTLVSLLLVGTSGFLVAAMAAMLVCFFLRYTTMPKEAREA